MFIESDEGKIYIILLTKEQLDKFKKNFGGGKGGPIEALIVTKTTLQLLKTDKKYTMIYAAMVPVLTTGGQIIIV